MTSLHPTEVVDPRANSTKGWRLGRTAWSGPHVRIGRGGRGSCGHVTVLGRVTREKRIGLFPEPCSACDPQRQLRGQRTELLLGIGTVIREGGDVNRATETEDG